MGTEPIRVLCVDDEQLVLDGLQRSLKSEFELTTAIDGQLALHLLDTAGPFDVIISDLRMPGMDGAAVLAAARTRAPDTTRILLTGQADLESTIRVINDGGIFRFLTKPTGRQDLVTAIREAADICRLRVGERVLLQQTLNGAVKALSDLLAASCPVAHGRSSRVRERVVALAQATGAPDAWQVEIAATVAMIGVMAVPDDVVARWLAGTSRPEDQPVINRIPQLSANAVAGIPRLDAVTTIVRRVHDAPSDPSVPWGARALRICQDFQDAMGRKEPPSGALARMSRRPETYDGKLLATFAVQVEALAGPEIRKIPFADLRVGMVLAEHLVTSSDLVLLAKGSVLTVPLLERIEGFRYRAGIREPVHVIVRA